MVFEQQVLYAVDQSHPDPKPTTFCNFLASTQGWNLVQSPEKNSNGRFDRKKYNDLLTSIRKNYDRSALQLASRQQLELDTVWACSSQRTTAASSQRPTASIEPFTM
jgi:hypothetical protein